jgi:hypothetical protein
MDSKNFSATATGLIGNFADTAHRAIAIYRQGGERLSDALEQRWKAGLKQSGPKLTPETRRNAARAQKAFSGYYAKGLALSADGAEAVIDTLAGAARTAIERAASYQQASSHKAG